MIVSKKAETDLGNATGNSGFTLIETLIAMAIFGIGILAVGSMQISAVKNNFSARMRTEATILAAELVEEKMTVAYDDVATTLAPQISGLYTWEMSVTDDYPIPNSKTVALTVCWEQNKVAPADCSAAVSKKTITVDFIRANL